MADWAAALVREGDTAVLLQYPGRGPRWNEPLPANLRELTDSAVAELAERTEGTADRLVFVGHSMGSAVCYEVAERLEEAGRHVALMVASAAPPPQLWSLDPDVVAGMTVVQWEDWIAAVGFDGGMEWTPEILDMAIPVLRGDCLLLARNRASTRPLRCPIMAIGGMGDPDVTPGRLGEWGSLTTGPVFTHLMPGGHFYYRERLPEVCGLIRATLGRSS
ncbi:thioesterase II family protein [Microbispora sp. H10670]|uniref:thioesterase II family protein n=1 Tax=Microbispora sp. H10670 TaxID=2729108 RepID=UPI0016006679